MFQNRISHRGRYGLRQLAVLCIFTAFLFRIVHSKLTLRVRLSDGAIQRIDMNDENDTVDDLITKLRSSGLIKSSDVSCSIKDCNYPLEILKTADASATKVTMQNIGLRAGDVITIIASSIPSFNTHLMNELRQKGSSKSVDSSKKSEVGKTKSKSIADLEKWRSNLVKITRQKSSTTVKSVSSTSSAGRILKRLANGGGRGLLIGKSIAASPAGASTKSLLVKGKPTSLKSVSSADDSSKAVVEVYGVVELFSGLSSNETPTYSTVEGFTSISQCDDGKSRQLCSPAAIALISEIAQSFGLSVVGCCVTGISPVVSHDKDNKQKRSSNNIDDKGRATTSWTDEHVYAALQMRSALSLSPEACKSFIVLR